MTSNVVGGRGWICRGPFNKEVQHLIWQSNGLASALASRWSRKVQRLLVCIVDSSLEGIEWQRATVTFRTRKGVRFMR